jgi:hypothetical protein
VSNVEKFYPADASKNPDNVLEQALGAYSDCLVLGWDADGNFDARCSQGLADGGDMLWLLETFKAKLLDGEFNAGDGE